MNNNMLGLSPSPIRPVGGSGSGSGEQLQPLPLHHAEMHERQLLDMDAAEAEDLVV